MGSTGLSRRGLVGGAAVGAATVLLPALPAEAATKPGRRKPHPKRRHKVKPKAKVPTKPTPEPTPPTGTDRAGIVRPRTGQSGAVTVRTSDGYLNPDLNLHVLRRMTFGPTVEAVAEINAIGPDAWFERQVNPSAVSDPVCDGVLATLPRLKWSIATTRAQLDNGSWDVMDDLGRAAVARAAWSNRQLYEVMVDFWSNHLNVTNPSSDVWDSRHRYDADVIRANTFGRFADMLKASAAHPSMLNYLDNADSSKDAPNENYGRELLELHTVGVESGYTQAEVVDSARIMTGYSLDWDTGEYLYRTNYHWKGAVSVRGFTSANSSSDGRAVVTAYLDHLARHPDTAKRIATKLYLRFIGDVPSPTAVASLAQVYLDNDTAIIPVLRALFRLPEFRRTPGVKVRRPFEAIIAGIRALGIKPPTTTNADDYRTGLNAVYWQVSDLANAPLAWTPPNGYPDTADAWQSASGMLGRWNTHLSHAAGWWPSKSDGMLGYPDLTTFLPSPLPNTYLELVEALSRRVLFRTMSPAHCAAVLAFMAKAPTARPKATDGVLTWKLSYVVALMLDSPYHGYR